MSTKFLTLSGDTGSLTDGTTNAYLGSLSASNLTASSALRTGATGVIESSDLSISDITDLQSTLDAKRVIIDDISMSSTKKVIFTDESESNKIQLNTGKTIGYDGTDILLTGDTKIDGDLEVTGSTELVRNNIDSSGVIDPDNNFILSDNGNDTYNVTGGEVYLKTTDSDIGSISKYTISAVTNVSIDPEATLYVYVDYNGGSPIITNTVVAEDVRSNENTKIELYEIHNNGGSIIHCTVHYHKASNVNTWIQRFLYEKHGTNRTSGLIVSEIATRNVGVTSGIIYTKLNRHTISAIDTSGADVFQLYYDDNDDGHTLVADQSQLGNTQYDDGSGVLANLTVNRYGFYEVFSETDGDLIIQYGTANTVSQSGAESVPVITDNPSRLVDHGTYIGRIIIREGTANFINIINPCETQLTFASATDHSALSNLGVDSHSQYLLVTGRTDESIDINGTGTINMNSATASRLLATDGSKDFISTDISSWISGTSNEIVVTDDSDGTVTLSLPLTIEVDIINESTSLEGVTVEDVLIKGNQIFTQKLSVNSLGSPNRGVLMLDGVDNNASTGPHMEFYSSGSATYPLLSIVPLTADNQSILFDSYYDGDFRSSDAGSNFKIQKTSDTLLFSYDSGISQGGVITYNDAIEINVDGAVKIANILTVDTINEFSDTGVEIMGSLLDNDAMHIGSTGIISRGRLNITGNSGSASTGPHIEAFISSDVDYPVVQMYHSNHDSISWIFDGYNDGTNWRSSDASNFMLNKSGNRFHISYDSGISAGSVLSWNTGFSMESTGQVKIPDAYTRNATARVLQINADGTIGNSSSLIEHKLNIEDLGPCAWIYQLEPKKFNRKRTDPYGNLLNKAFPAIEFNFLAEDIEQIIPAVCDYDREVQHIVDCPDSEYKYKSQCDCMCPVNNTLHGIHIEYLIPALVKIVQTQKTTIDDLIEDIEDLTTRIETLESL